MFPDPTEEFPIADRPSEPIYLSFKHIFHLILSLVRWFPLFRISSRISTDPVNPSRNSKPSFANSKRHSRPTRLSEFLPRFVILCCFCFYKSKYSTLSFTVRFNKRPDSNLYVRNIRHNKDKSEVYMSVQHRKICKSIEPLESISLP